MKSIPHYKLEMSLEYIDDEGNSHNITSILCTRKELKDIERAAKNFVTLLDSKLGTTIHIANKEGKLPNTLLNHSFNCLKCGHMHIHKDTCGCGCRETRSSDKKARRKSQ